MTSRRSVAPYHSCRPSRATPRVRTPSITRAATGSTRVAQRVLVARRDGTARSSQPSPDRRPNPRRSDSDGLDTAQVPSASATETGSTRTSSKT